MYLCIFIVCFHIRHILTARIVSRYFRASFSASTLRPRLLSTFESISRSLGHGLLCQTQEVLLRMRLDLKTAARGPQITSISRAHMSKQAEWESEKITEYYLHRRTSDDDFGNSAQVFTPASGSFFLVIIIIRERKRKEKKVISNTEQKKRGMRKKVPKSDVQSSGRT